MNKTYSYLFINWVIIVLAIYLGNRFFFIYPLAFIIIANRQFANYLVGHEGVHGLISKNKLINDTVGKYLCLFPIYVSFDTYKTYHQSHHSFLGTNLDPDKKLYDFYPKKRSTFILTTLSYFLTGGMMRDFFIYFTPFYVIYKSKSIKKIFSGDALSYLVFNLIVLVSVFYFNMGIQYLLFWILPLIFFIPYYYFVSALQHGLINLKGEELNSRNIIGNAFLMEILLPCRTNYHGIHHQYPTVAFYNLKKVYDKQLGQHSSYANTIKELLPTE